MRHTASQMTQGPGGSLSPPQILDHLPLNFLAEFWFSKCKANHAARGRPRLLKCTKPVGRPVNHSCFKITWRSFYHTAPSLWNSLPADLRQTTNNYSQATSLFALSPSVCHEKNSKPTCFIGLFLLKTLLTTWMDISGIDLTIDSSLSIFILFDLLSVWV